jgi:tRNA-dihydrouridine synthase
MENLDLKCAELGKRLTEQDGVAETLLTDALSVLEEQGVYAYFLFLRTRRGREQQPAEAACNASARFLRETPAASPLLANGDVFDALQRLGEDLDKLLFARDLLRQALVYGRYHAKARDGAREGP